MFRKHQIDVKLEGGEEGYMGYLTLEVEITPMTEKQKNLVSNLGVFIEFSSYVVTQQLIILL